LMQVFDHLYFILHLFCIDCPCKQLPIGRLLVIYLMQVFDHLYILIIISFHIYFVFDCPCKQLPIGHLLVIYLMQVFDHLYTFEMWGNCDRVNV
jgi:hypothetical protein